MTQKTDLTKPSAASPVPSQNGKRPLRVLMLAIAFPRPNLPTFAVWALKQAQAIQRQGVDIHVVSLVPWLPTILAKRSATAKKYIDCPARHNWNGLEVEYPRWLLYQFGRLKQQSMKNPAPQQAFAWRFIKGRLLKKVRDFKPDVIYAHHTWTNGDLARRLHEATGIPFVVTDHDFGEIDSCELYPTRQSYHRRVMEQAFCTVAVSKRMENGMRHHILADGRIRTIYNGADPMPADVLARPRPPELQSKLIVHSAGLYYLRKGFPKLIEAFAKVAPKYPQAVLRISGDGKDRPAIEQAIRQNSLESRVALLGMQPHDQVLQEMAWSDIFALIAIDEPFATVFSEAMSAGKPLVWASDGGFADVVADGTNGYAVAPLSVEQTAIALDKLIGDAQARDRMGQANRTLLESTLTWDANARAMVTLLGLSVERMCGTQTTQKSA